MRFYPDGVHRHDGERGTADNSANEGTHSGRGHFSDINFVDKTKFPMSKLSSITTDGAPAMVGRCNGFIAKCREDDTFPDFHNYHCIIHQHAKLLNMKEVMDVSLKVACSIRARPLQRWLFRAYLEDADCVHTDLLLHTDVRWLSTGNFLQRFRVLLPEIKEFLHGTNLAEYARLDYTHVE